MSDDQVQSGSNDAASNANNLEEFKQRIAELERANRGLLEDTKSERKRRQEMEEEISKVRYSLSSAAQETPDVNPQVEQFWNQYFAPKVKAFVEPLQKNAEFLSRKDAYRDALDWLADQEESRPSKIRGSKLERDLEDIAKENGLNGLDIVNGTKAAYQIYKAKKDAEIKAKAEKETKREEAISSQSTESVTSPAAVSSKKFRASDIASMSDEDYAKNRQAILDAYSSGIVENDLKRRRE